MTGSSLAKIASVTLLVFAVATYGWYRLRPRAPYPVARISSNTFNRMNSRGQLLGSGPDTLVIFSNYRCVYCAELFGTIDSILTTDVSSFTVRLRHFAHPSVDSSSFLASVAAECASQQGRFVEFSRWLFGNREQLEPFLGPASARASAVPNLVSFDDCFESKHTRSLVTEDLRAGMELRISGTPTILTRRRMVTARLSSRELMALVSSTK